MMKKIQNITNQGIVILLLILFGLNAIQAQTIPTPTQTDQILPPDNGAAGKADPGDKIRYKVTIENTHPSTPANNVQLNAAPDSRTTLDPLSFRTTPLAFPEAYSSLGNVGITVPAANGLLINDYDDNMPGLTVMPVSNAATTSNGSITITADGGFSYNPPSGFEGADTYQYTLIDGNDVDGIGPIPGTDVGTITFTVSGMIWFINNNAGACMSNCDGRLSNPYTSLTAFNTANALAGGLNPDNNDNIFIYESATAYAGGIVLRSGQKLFGQDATATLAAMTGLTPPMFSNPLPATNSVNGTKVTITNTTVGGNGITLSTNNTLRGLTVGNTATTGSGAGINGNGIGALTINEVSINGTGQILTLNNGSVTASFIELSTTSTNQTAVVLSNLTAGSVTDVDGSGSSISGASGVFSITSGTTTNLAFTFNGDVTHAGANPLVFVQNHGTGTVTFQNGTLSSTGGGINFTNADGTYNFNGTTTLTGTSRITIDGGSSGMFNFNSNTSVTNSTNIAFDLNGSNATVDYNGTLSSNTAFRLIDIANNTGGSASFDGNLTFTGNATGIRVQQNTGGTYSFNGSSKTISSGANTAVNLVTNAGAIINFTGGGLVINTTSGTGFNATGGGTVTVQGTGNTINSTSGATALNVVSTAIGASGLTFLSISSTGGTAPGINLNTTGSGGLTVTGDGGGSNNGSGGSITNKTGSAEATGTPGVRLFNVSNVRLKYMNITGCNHSGIYGGLVANPSGLIDASTINGFQLERCNITGNGDTGGSLPDEVGVDLYNLVGTAIGGSNPTSIVNCTISMNYEFELQITNRTSTALTDLQMSGNTISNTTAAAGHGNLINFLGEGGGAANMTLNLTSGTFTGNAPFTATAVQCDHSGTGGTMTANISGATFTNNNVGPQASVAGGAHIVFNFSNNTVTGNRSTGINVFADANPPFTKSIEGTIQNNTVGTLGVPNSGANLGIGIRVQNEGSIPCTLLITGNTIQEVTNFQGINVNVGISLAAGGHLTAVTCTNNTIRNINNSRAIAIQDNATTAHSQRYVPIFRVM